MAVHHAAKKLVKAKEQVVLSTGEVMTLGEALDRGLATVGTIEQRALRPKGDRLTVRSYYAEDTNSGELWPISRALFESRTTGTFKPGSPAPAAPTKHAPSSSSSAATPTSRYMVTSYGDDVGYFADLPSAIRAADRYQEETDRVVKIFDGNRALAKGEIEGARKALHSEGTTRHHATKKSPAQLQHEIDEVLGVQIWAKYELDSEPELLNTVTDERAAKYGFANTTAFAKYLAGEEEIARGRGWTVWAGGKEDQPKRQQRRF